MKARIFPCFLVRSWSSLKRRSRKTIVGGFVAKKMTQNQMGRLQRKLSPCFVGKYGFWW